MGKSQTDATGEALAFAFALAFALGLIWPLTAMAIFLNMSSAVPNSLALKGCPHPWDSSKLSPSLITSE